MPLTGPDDTALTMRLALFVGAFLVVAAIGLIRSRTMTDAMLAELHDRPGTLHAVAATTFFAGGGLLVVHHGLGSVMASLITLTAAWWLIEGAALLIAGRAIPFATPAACQRYWLSQFVALGIGLTLIALALVGR